MYDHDSKYKVWLGVENKCQGGITIRNCGNTSTCDVKFKDSSPQILFKDFNKRDRLELKLDEYGEPKIHIYDQQGNQKRKRWNFEGVEE